jgi:hypothetical protein
VLERQINALEDHHQKSWELPGSKSVIMQNQEIQVRNKRNRQTFDLDMAETTSSSMDENSGTSTAILTYSIQYLKTGLTLTTFFSSKKLCNGQTHRKESLRKCGEDAICNNMQSKESFYLKRKQVSRTC